MSAVPQARRHLLAKLGDDPGFAGVDVLDAYATDYGHQAVAVLSPIPGETRWVALGSGRFDFSFVLLIKIEVGGAGFSAVDSEDRADELLVSLVDMIKADPKLGGVLNKEPARVTIRDWSTFPDDDGMKTVIDLGLACEVRW